MGDIARWLRAEWDRVAGFGLIGLGALLLVLGYSGVSRSPYVAEQLAYVVSGGMGGLFCLGFGAVLLLGADLHDEWRKLDKIEVAIRQSAGAPPAPARAEPPTTADRATDHHPGEGGTNGSGAGHITDPGPLHAGNGAGKAPRPRSARARGAGSGRPS
jgi:hypothetical protein